MSKWIKAPPKDILTTDKSIFEGDKNGGLWDEDSHCVINFLWKNNNVYVMDNHLAAGWCWLHECCSLEEYNLLHIDQHTDDICCIPEERIREEYPMLCDEIEFNEYCDLAYKKHGKMIKLFQCERYIRPISIFHPSWFCKCIFATHQRSNLDIVKKMVDNKELIDHLHSPIQVGSNEVASNILNIKDCKKKWIVNIDLDYLYKDEEQVLDKNYFHKISSAISEVRENIEVITIALSPHWCKGLRDSLDIMSYLSKGIPELQQFSLGEF